MYIFILNPTFSRVLIPLKTMDSTDSLHFIKKAIVLYPLLCLLTNNSYGTCILGVQDTVKYGIHVLGISKCTLRRADAPMMGRWSPTFPSLIQPRLSSHDIAPASCSRGG